ncbi:MAG: flippase-like domain-containing protein [Chloroflexi bacterium]|nr:flippase-like domain-containing protein [Chloroflexota bacterium]
MKRWISLLIGLVFSLFFLWLGFRNLKFDDLWDILRDINPLWLLLTVPVYGIATYLISWRWYALLRPVKDVPPRRLFKIVYIGYMANNLLPFRLGEVMRAYVLKRHDDVPIPPTLTTILIERIFDGLTMLTFIFTALLFAGDKIGTTLRTVVAVTTPLFFVALLVFLALAAAPDLARKIYTPIISTLLPSGLRQKVLALMEHFLSGLEALRSGRALVGVVVFSFASWAVEASTYWIVMHAFDFQVSFFVMLLVIGFSTLTTVLPSTSGYVGTFHAAAILTLTAFDVPRVDAASFALVIHATLWIQATLIGFIYLAREGLHWSDFGRAQTEVEQAEHQTELEQHSTIELRNEETLA